MKNIEDLRVIKTKENIRNSFLCLLKEKSFEKITIKELCEKAKISRNTFYFHYEYKQNLYDTIIDECVDTINSGFRPIVNNLEEIDEEILFKYISNFLDEFHKVKDTLNIILSQDRGLFSLRLSKSFNDSIIYNASLITDKRICEKYNLYINYISSGLVGFLLGWVQNENFTIDEVKEFLFLINRTPMKVAMDVLK